MLRDAPGERRAGPRHSFALLAGYSIRPLRMSRSLFVRLAGLRVDVATNGPHNAPRFNNLVLKKVADGHEEKIDLPLDFYVSQLSWSPDGHKIAFTHATGLRH